MRVGGSAGQGHPPARAAARHPLRGGHLRLSEREPLEESRQAGSLRELLLRDGTGGNTGPPLRPLRAHAAAALGRGVHRAREAGDRLSPVARPAPRRPACRDPRVRFPLRALAGSGGGREGRSPDPPLDARALDQLARGLSLSGLASGARGEPDDGRTAGRARGSAPGDQLPRVGAEPHRPGLRLPDRRQWVGGVCGLRSLRSRPHRLRPPRAPLRGHASLRHDSRGHPRVSDVLLAPALGSCPTSLTGGATPVRPAERIAITAAGVVTPVGQDVEAFWSSLVTGASGISQIERFSVADLRVGAGGEIKKLSRIKSWSRIPDCRATRLLVSAADELATQSGFRSLPVDSARVAVVVGTALGGVEEGEKVLAGDPRRRRLRGALYDSPAYNLARWLGAGGPVLTVSTACASGATALAVGADLLRQGEADAVLAGGYDILCRFVMRGFDALRSLTRDVIRPFDRRRSGL